MQPGERQEPALEGEGGALARDVDDEGVGSAVRVDVAVPLGVEPVESVRVGSADATTAQLPVGHTVQKPLASTAAQPAYTGWFALGLLAAMHRPLPSQKFHSTEDCQSACST